MPSVGVVAGTSARIGVMTFAEAPVRSGCTKRRALVSQAVAVAGCGVGKDTRAALQTRIEVLVAEKAVFEGELERGRKEGTQALLERLEKPPAGEGEDPG